MPCHDSSVRFNVDPHLQTLHKREVTVILDKEPEPLADPSPQNEHRSHALFSARLAK
jgi:hypothetical protein